MSAPVESAATMVLEEIEIPTMFVHLKEIVIFLLEGAVIQNPSLKFLTSRFQQGPVGSMSIGPYSRVVVEMVLEGESS